MTTHYPTKNVRLSIELWRAAELLGTTGLALSLGYMWLAWAISPGLTLLASACVVLMIISTISRDRINETAFANRAYNLGYDEAQRNNKLRARTESLEQPEVRATLPPELIQLHEELNSALATGAVAASRANSLSLEIVEGLTRLNTEINAKDSELTCLRRTATEQNDRITTIARTLGYGETGAKISPAYVPEALVEIESEKIARAFAPDLAELESALGELRAEAGPG